jgi:hypothetical protein
MRSSLRWCSIAVWLLLATGRAAGQPADLWAPFLGAWRGSGTALTRPAIGEAEWQRVLGGRFVRLDMSFTPVGAGRPAFFGHAYYSTTDSTGHWIDSQGTYYALVHARVGDTLRVRFTLTSGAAAESAYWRAHDGALIERTRSRRPTGEWVEFLSYRYTQQTRQPERPDRELR